MTPYRVPSWPKRKPWPSPRRFKPVRGMPAHASLLLTITGSLLLVALYVLHTVTLAIRVHQQMRGG